MNKSKRRNFVFVAAVAIVIVILAAVLLKTSKKEETEVAELGIKEIIGNTPEERLAGRIDVSSAKIAKIENVDELR